MHYILEEIGVHATTFVRFDAEGSREETWTTIMYPEQEDGPQSTLNYPHIRRHVTSNSRVRTGDILRDVQHVLPTPKSKWAVQPFNFNVRYRHIKSTVMC